jgi:type III pantothenate kinase
VGLRENRSVPFSVTAARGREFQAAIASVVPAMTEIMVETCRRALGCEAFVIRPGITTGMRLGYDDPRQLGADRLANAVAAYERVGDAVIVVDAGTATKVEYVSRAGTFEGGVIAPGPGIAGEALFERAARLSRVELVRPATVIGRTTPAAVQSGLVHGFAALVDGLVRRLWREAGPTGAVLATGGFAGLLATAAETITAIHPFLTLDGVRILYDRNCSTTRDGRLHG